MLENKSKIGVQPMWSVGNLDWLLALHYSGIVPGIVYSRKSDHNHFLDTKEWDKFFNITDNIIIASNQVTFRDKHFHKFLLRYKPKYLEIYDAFTKINPDPGIGQEDIDYYVLDTILPRIGTKVYIKGINRGDGGFTALGQSDIVDHVHAVNVKNNTAAGTTSEQTLEESIRWAKEKFDLPIIASGGLGTKSDIEFALKLGADNVLIGTLFAAAEESNLSAEAKKMLLDRNSNDIAFIKQNNSNLLVKENIADGDDFNYSNNLMHTVRDGNNGILYAGKAIDHISAIKPVKDIVAELLGT